MPSDGVLSVEKLSINIVTANHGVTSVITAGVLIAHRLFWLGIAGCGGGLLGGRCGRWRLPACRCGALTGLATRGWRRLGGGLGSFESPSFRLLGLILS